MYPPNFGPNLEITQGYWVQLATNSCQVHMNGNETTNELTQFCDGYALYDDFMRGYTVYTLPHCYFQMFEPLSQRLYQCLNNRPLLFLGDSTLEKTIGVSLVKRLLNDKTWTENRKFKLIQNIKNNDTDINIQLYFYYNGAYTLAKNHMGLTSFYPRNHTFFYDVLDPIYFKNDTLCVTEVIFVCILYYPHVLYMHCFAN